MRTGTVSAAAREGGAVFNDRDAGEETRRMANQWFRLWHDMPNDPKWRTIARVSGRPIAEVIGVYLHLLNSASQSVTRGNASVTTEDLASALDMENGHVEAIKDAMQGRVLNGDWLTGWDKRQVKKEEDTNPESRAKSNAERQREYRERKRQEASNDGVTASNEASRNVTTDKDKDTDKENNSSPNGEGGRPPKLTSPDEIIFGYGVPLLTGAGAQEKQARSFLGGLRKHHGDQAVVDALRDCLKAKPLQPLEWLAAALPPAGRKNPGRHTGFSERDYHEGVNPDGTF